MDRAARELRRLIVRLADLPDGELRAVLAAFTAAERARIEVLLVEFVGKPEAGAARIQPDHRLLGYPDWVNARILGGHAEAERARLAAVFPEEQRERIRALEANCRITPSTSAALHELAALHLPALSAESRIEARRGPRSAGR
jgi:hypothetical protein